MIEPVDFPTLHLQSFRLPTLVWKEHKSHLWKPLHSFNEKFIRDFLIALGDNVRPRAATERKNHGDAENATERNLGLDGENHGSHGADLSD